MNDQLRTSFDVDGKIYQEHASGRDRSLIDAFILSVFVAALLIGIGVGAIVYYFSGNYYGAIPTGFVAFYLVYRHDKTLLSVKSITTIYIRLGFSLLLALSLFLCYEGVLTSDYIKKEVIDYVKKYNLLLDQTLAEKKAAIDDEEKEVMDKFTDLSREAQQNWPSYEAAKQLKKNFLENKPRRIAALEEEYSAQKITADTSKMNVLQFHIGQTLSGDFSSRSYLSLILVLLLLIFEAAPSLFRLALDQGDYLSEVSRIRDNVKTVAAEEKVVEQEIIEEQDGNITPLLLKKAYLSEKKKQAKNGFKDIETLLELSDKIRSMNGQAKPGAGRKNGPDSDDLEFPGFDYENA